MCGIIGIVNFNKGNSDLTSRVNSMAEEIVHRGPDFKAIFKNNIGVFGFLRLSIIDLSVNSNQPFQTDDKKISIIYNGEIYNFKKLKNTYFKNKNFRSKGDGEILLYLYIKFGINFLSKIKGMFSICIVDENLKKIFLIRDRFGIKPLYYYFNSAKHCLYFSSEIKSIFCNREIKKELNYKEAFKFFKQGLVNGNSETWFKNIFQVKSAHYLEFDEKNINQKKYYSLEDNIDEDEDKYNYSFKSYINKFKENLIESFDEHNQFDVKCGVHLSGGSDSAVIAALCNYFKKDYYSYTFDFKEKKFSEINEAKKISNSASLINKSTILPVNKISDYLLKVLNREFEPFSSLRILSSHFLYDTFKNEARVILDGNGGDEIGAGYNYHIAPWYLDIIKDKKIKANARLNKIVNLIHNSNKKKPVDNFFKGSLSHFKNPGSSTADGSFYKFDEVLNKEFSEMEDYSMLFKRPFKSNLRNAQYLDLMYLKLPRTLKYVDRASMYNSIETRVPFLDHKVVERAFSIPSKFKILNSQQRIITKYPFKNFVDKSVLFMNKKSIADPQTHWLKNDLSNLLLETISSNEFNSHGLFKKQNVKSYVNKFLSHEDHFNSYLIFQILIFEIWYKNIILKT